MLFEMMGKYELQMVLKSVAGTALKAIDVGGDILSKQFI